MTSTSTPNESIRNGVDTATMFATLDEVKETPSTGRFQFRVEYEWIDGAHNRVTIVDRALELSGGAGYMTGSPLARAVRDVRAGAFTNPLSSRRAYEFLAGAALGREVSL